MGNTQRTVQDVVSTSKPVIEKQSEIRAVVKDWLDEWRDSVKELNDSRLDFVKITTIQGVMHSEVLFLKRGDNCIYYDNAEGYPEYSANASYYNELSMDMEDLLQFVQALPGALEKHIERLKGREEDIDEMLKFLKV